MSFLQRLEQYALFRFYFCAVSILLLTKKTVSGAPTSTSYTNTSIMGNITASDSTLQTWWHDSGEVNYQTPVQQENVRQSHLYSASVKSTADSSGT